MSGRRVDRSADGSGASINDGWGDIREASQAGAPAFRARGLPARPRGPASWMRSAHEELRSEISTSRSRPFLPRSSERADGNRSIRCRSTGRVMVCARSTREGFGQAKPLVVRTQCVPVRMVTRQARFLSFRGPSPHCVSASRHIWWCASATARRRPCRPLSADTVKLPPIGRFRCFQWRLMGFTTWRKPSLVPWRHCCVAPNSPGCSPAARARRLETPAHAPPPPARSMPRFGR